MYVSPPLLYFYLIMCSELFSSLTQAANLLIPDEMNLPSLVIFNTLAGLYFIGLFEYNQST